MARVGWVSRLSWVQGSRSAQDQGPAGGRRVPKPRLLPRTRPPRSPLARGSCRCGCPSNGDICGQGPGDCSDRWPLGSHRREHSGPVSEDGANSGPPRPALPCAAGTGSSGQKQESVACPGDALVRRDKRRDPCTCHRTLDTRGQLCAQHERAHGQTPGPGSARPLTPEGPLL